MQFPLNATIASTAVSDDAILAVGLASFNLNISVVTGTPSGTLYVKYLILPTDVAAAIPAWQTIPLNSGLFLNGKATYNLSSGSSLPSQTLGIYWVPTGTPAGSLLISGVSK